jgi:hypothetical protein
MNYLIIGIILTVLGIVFTGYGTITKNKETKEFQDTIIDLTEKLTKPEINVLGIEENLNNGINSYFVIKAKNTGGNDCFDAKLIIDRHNSPLGKNFAIQSIEKFPKGASVDYKIPLFQSMVMAKLAETDITGVNKEFKNNFLKRYQNNEAAIVIFYHFEYKWNDETLKSSQFLIVKSINEKPYLSSREEYVDTNQQEL